MPARAVVSPTRRQHILDGDATGGGHRHGTSGSEKTPFPQSWSDDKIINEIQSIANDTSCSRTIQANNRIRVEGTRDGVDICVVIDADGVTIRTGFPTNLPRNP